MGRHSAPDVADELADGDLLLATVDDVPTGRHSRATDDRSAATDAPAVEPAPVRPRPGPVPDAATKRARFAESRADLALLRADRGLRARCLAAVLVPFAVWALVLLLVGAHGVQWVYWLPVPAVVGGVLVGTFLDLAHRSAARARAAAVTVTVTE